MFYAYIESINSLAFQFIPFESEVECKQFIENINKGDNTLKAQFVDSFYRVDLD